MASTGISRSSCDDGGYGEGFHAAGIFVAAGVQLAQRNADSYALAGTNILQAHGQVQDAALSLHDGVSNVTDLVVLAFFEIDVVVAGTGSAAFFAVFFGGAGCGGVPGKPVRRAVGAEQAGSRTAGSRMTGAGGATREAGRDASRVGNGERGACVVPGVWAPPDLPRRWNGSKIDGLHNMPPKLRERGPFPARYPVPYDEKDPSRAHSILCDERLL